MRPIIFELCAETVDACIAAREGGAHRIELCSGLSEGGLTPSHGLVRAAVESAGLPIHVLVRPRGGDFHYSDAEIAVMCEDILHVKQLGAAGVVLGALHADGTVDLERNRTLVEASRPMEVTFHRAFDATPSLAEALEAVIATGCDRILTSGGERDVTAGAAQLAALVKQSAERVEIAVGGGLRLQNAGSLARLTGARHFHGSLRRRVAAGSTQPSRPAGDDPQGRGHRYVVDAEAVRAMVSRLQQEP